MGSDGASLPGVASAPPADAAAAADAGGGRRPAKRAKTAPPRGAAKYRRGDDLSTRGIADVKLKDRLKRSERLARDAQAAAARVDDWLLPPAPGGLEPEGPLERTWAASQAAVAGAAERGAGRKAFDLALGELGPYRVGFTASGRHAVLAGRRGHLAVVDWARAAAACELQVRETVRDAVFLHNETFFAAAQKKYVFVYDKRGVEVHRLKEHTEAARLAFLPQHFLLASVGAAGVLRYQDTSTGQVVAQHRTRLGPCAAVALNAWNGVLVLGHAGGTASMWTPTQSAPAARLLCHRGPVRAVAVDGGGRHLVTAGADGQVRVWDVRALRPLHAYFSRRPAEHLAVSQRGLLAVAAGRRVAVWRDALAAKAAAPYMAADVPGGGVAGLVFCPYDDVLAAGAARGVSSLLVPGAGEPNYDSLVADPYSGLKARREAEVRALLDKLQPETIALDPGEVGRVRREPAEVQRARAAEAAAADAAARAAARAKADERTKMKGKNKPTRRLRKKQQNVVEERRPKLKAALRAEGVAAERGHERAEERARAAEEALRGVPRALHRFHRK